MSYYKSLPETYTNKAGVTRRIKRRRGYSMSGEVTCLPSTNNTGFASNKFQHNLSEPMEVLRMIVHPTTLDVSAVPQVDNPQLASSYGDVFRWLRMQLAGVGSALKLTKEAAMLTTLCEQSSGVLNGARWWEFDEPYYLESGDGWEPTVDNLLAIGSAAGGIRVELNFKGSLLVLE